jgi:mannose-1-phosphate guanylyltransferase
MKKSNNNWVVVLAAGDGNRLRSVTTNDMGDAVPKQFCSLRGGPSLLLETLERSESVATPDHICVVVASQHRRWWRAMLSRTPFANVIVQPMNRGTANGILLPLLHIKARDPDARIMILPSDHYVRDVPILVAAMESALGHLDNEVEEINLLGIRPERADPDLGYIIPGLADGPGVSRVDRFIEKPSELLARHLVDAGGLWNAFILTARIGTLLNLFASRHPHIVATMQSAIGHDGDRIDDLNAMFGIYRELPMIDFSRHLLAGAETFLRVLTVGQCGWNDIGTPERLVETLRSMPGNTRTQSMDPQIAALNLWTQYAAQDHDRHAGQT